MPKPARDPWIAVDATIRKNAKMATLPSDSARWGWIGVLGEAKLQRPAGRFASRTHFMETAGRFGRFLGAYLACRLLEIAPGFCDRCRVRWGVLPDGVLVIHDWHLHQRDPGSADRADTWRIERGSNDDQTPIEQGLNGPDQRSISVQSAFDQRSMDVQSAFVSRAQAATVTVTATRTETTKGLPTPERAAAAPTNGTTQPKKVRGFTTLGEVDLGQTMDKRQFEAWQSFGPEWHDFKLAWLTRGLKYPPMGSELDNPGATNPSQRALLWSILQARPNDLVRWIREAPRGGSTANIIGHVLREWHAVREEVGRESPTVAR